MAAMVQENVVADLASTVNDLTMNGNGNNNNIDNEDLSDVDDNENSNTGEESDVFVTDSNGGTSRPLFDLSLINRQHNAHPAPGRRGGTDSVATTADIASSVGSVMMMPKEAFLKSFTFYPEDDINWGIAFAAPQRTNKGFRAKQRLPVAMIEEDSIFSLSRIREGDYLKSINGKTVGPSYTPERALTKMQESLEKDGYMQVVTKNREEGFDDILVHATIIKPRPNMTLAELGMTVWIWGYLCIKEIKRDTIFKRTVLKDTDNIVSINEIVCENVNPEQFADIVRQLPREITVTVLRRKQRANVDFN